MTTDKSDYGAGETVVMTGSGYDCGVALTVQVTRPDGSIVVGDGSFNPGSDSVVTDGNGEFVYEYILNGIVGIYSVEVIDSAGTVLATTTFRDSHFRYGHITWTPGSGNTVNFVVQNAWRRSGYTTCVDVTTSTLISCSGADGLPAVGDVVREAVGGTRLFAGDGAVIGSSFGQLLYVVTSIEPANDWFFGLALDPNSLPSIDTTISHTYSVAGDYTASINSCCRTFEEINNPSGSYRVQTIVNVGSGNRSPVSALPPIVQCPINALCSFTVPGSDADGDSLAFRLSTSSEAGGFFDQPGPPDAANAAAIDASTGVYTWDTSGATLASSGPTFYSTQVTIDDGSSTVAVDFFIQLVPVVGAPPAFTSPICGATVDANAGSAFGFDVTATDPDGDDVTLNVAGLPSTATMTPSLPTTATGTVTSAFAWTPTSGDEGPNVITFTAIDDTGQQALCSYTVNVVVATNQPPVAVPGGPYTGVEGSAVSFDGTGSSDPDGDALTYSWDFGDASAPATGDSPSHTYADNGTYTVCLTVDDGTDTDTECTTAEIANVAPTVSPIAVSSDLVEVDGVINTSASFTDPGVLDTHTAEWDWGDGTTSAGTVTEVNGDGTATGSHAYTEAGVYTVTLTVTDKDGGVDSVIYEFVVVYDPGAGFVTGGGWIDSAPGAYHPDPLATGRASFGFVSKYKKGASVPTGNTEFQFRAGNLNFHSSSYEWLVVTGSDYARFKGVGTINGDGEYRFQIWAGDGEPDTFRIKIWSEDETTGVETVVYDNGFDQPLGHGSIVIHTKGS